MVPQPGDGNCLFNAIAAGSPVPLTAAELRRLCVAHIQASTDLREWVLRDPANKNVFRQRLGFRSGWLMQGRVFRHL